MHRVFLDANVLFSAAYRPDTGLLQLWKLEDTLLCSSRYAIEEARNNLSNNEQRERLIKLSRRLGVFESVHQALPRGFSLPEKDVPIVLAAISARATHLLTGDIRHFGLYLGKKIAGIMVLLPAEYLKIRREE
jgi:predicted nucleic acid-binding protein